MTDQKKPGGCSCVLLDLDQQPLCGEPSVAAFVTGCENEHFEEQEPLCSLHQEMVRAGDLWCTDCWQLGLRVRMHVLAEVLPSGELRRSSPAGQEV